MRGRSRITMVAATVACSMALLSCGSDDDTDDASVDTGSESPADVAATDETEPADSSTTDSAPRTTATDEDVGMITVAGTTTELATADFDICETVNPAFEGDFNIVSALEDGTYFRLSGNVDDHSADHQGLVFGRIPEEERAEDLEVTLDGRTLSGTASIAVGPVEFSFTC